MPTITTTVTSASTCGKVVTQTTTEATQEPPALVSAATAEPSTSSPPPILKDGVPINDSIFPKIGIPSVPDDITAEWVTSCLKTRGIISQSNSITEVELKQIGEGRGYANYTVLAGLKFKKPVSPDTPVKVVVKLVNKTFQEMFLNGQPPLMWKWANDFYVCEANFYQDYKHNCPAPMCKYFWSEIEYPVDPGQQMGSYGLMIEYLGDDLKMYSMAEGMPVANIKEVLTQAAKCHAASWNDSTLLPCQAGGSNHYINAGSMMATCFKQYTTEEGFQLVKKQYADMYGETDPLLPELAQAAWNKFEKWFPHSERHGHKCLSSFDLRAENVIWRKKMGATGDANADYDAILIDHQAWCYSSPGRDIAVLILSSMILGEMKDNVMNCIKFYYEELLKYGVDGAAYTFDMLLHDVKISSNISMLFIGAISKMLESAKEAQAGMDGTESNYQEQVNMITNMEEMQKTMLSKCAAGMRAVDAINPEMIAYFESI